MARLPLGLIVLGIACVLGCQSGGDEVAAAQTTKEGDSAPPPRRGVGLPEGWELVPKATYTARQSKGVVTIRATGEHPQANYEAQFFPSPLKIWPPQHLLARRKTAGAGATVMTPFQVIASFKSDQPVAAVRVTDARGVHEVKVEPTE